MDILMPLPDGMKAAERLRRVDESVCLIFVTNMAQLAIRGYKVGATDFLVKPVSYFDFSMEMDKIVRARAPRQRLHLGEHGGFDAARRLFGYLLYRDTHA